MSPRSNNTRQRIYRDPITGERDFSREADADSRRERRMGASLAVASVISVIIFIVLVAIMRSSTSCSGEQTVEVYTGDNLTVLILGNVDGALDDSVSIEGIIALVTADQPELSGTIKSGESVTLPKSCSGNAFGSSWDRGQR